MPNIVKSLALSLLAVFGVRTEEQPPYTVVDRIGVVEIRQYSARLSAETTVPASSENEARSAAFKILAGYIFGNNTDRRQLSMTSPVLTKAREIDMAAPVETLDDGAKTLTMRFFLPSDIKLGEAPVPNDPRVNIAEVPAEQSAVVQFSGSWTKEAFATKQRTLVAALDGSK
jgi:hypothetical protein